MSSAGRPCPRQLPTVDKALVLLTAKASRRMALLEEGSQIARRRPPALRRSHVTVMAGYRLDPLRWASTAPVHDVTIELRCGPQPVEPWRALQPLADRLFAHADASKSSVLVGQDYVFRACPPQPVRFQYLMRRRADLTHEAYAKHYSEVHSRFGYKTRGVEGYAQFHVDPAASSRAARLLGLDTIEVDGVSQLYLRSLGRFLLATPINATIGAGRDERNFVGASAMLTSRVIASAGPAAEALR